MIGWDEPSDDGGCALTGFTVEQRGVDETGFKFVAAVGGNVTQHQVSVWHLSTLYKLKPITDYTTCLLALEAS